MVIMEETPGQESGQRQPSPPSIMSPERYVGSLGLYQLQMTLRRFRALDRYPPTWKGTLRYSYTDADVELRVIGGKDDLGTVFPRFASDAKQKIYINKKTKCDFIWKRQLQRKFGRNRRGLVTILALPADNSYSSFNNLVSIAEYLRVHKAAGVVECGTHGAIKSEYIAYFFPKDTYTKEHLAYLDPALCYAISQEPYLVIVFDSYKLSSHFRGH